MDVLVLIAWIIGTIIAAVIASIRKISVGLVVLLSVFFTPVIGVLVACLMFSRAQEVSAKTASSPVLEKKCPKCAEMVKTEAVICRFCGYDFAPDIAADQEARRAGEQAERLAEEARIAKWEADAPRRAAEEKAGEKQAVIMMVLMLAVFMILGSFIIVVTLNHSSRRGSSQATPNASAAETAAITTSKTVQDSPWTVRTKTNPINGVSTLYAESGYGDQSMVIRETGKKLELFINTGNFLETTSNMDSGVVGITYRIDGSKPVHQNWSLSSDNTSLFYPGNPTPLIQKLRSAKTFYFQYPPSEEVPKVIKFDVDQFPKEILTESAIIKPKHHAVDN